jgi:peptidoglycan/xylan/chitin deacetylase (PgdA/CDA1 family)
MVQARRKAPRSRGHQVIVAAVIAVWLLAVGLVATAILFRLSSTDGDEAGAGPDPSSAPPAASEPAAEPAAPTPTPEPPPGYTVTLSVPDGATVSPASLHLDPGQPVTALPYAHADGQRFLGWFTAPADPADRVDNATLNLIPVDQDTTLHARFEPKPTEVDYASAGLPILMYHYFYDPDQGQTGENGNWMDIRLFREQLAWLRDNGYYYPTWEEANLYLRGDIVLPEKSVILTSDDGAPSFYQLAIAEVMAAGAKITSFVVAIDFETPNLALYDPERVFFRSHSYDMHRWGPGGSARLLESTAEEVAEDVELGAAVLGTRDVYCYPFGSNNETARAALAGAGVQLALAIENLKAYPMMDPMQIPRLRMSDGISLDYFISVVAP